MCVQVFIEWFGNLISGSEYPFAKYNKNSTPSYTYSLDEYTRLLEGEFDLPLSYDIGSFVSVDPEWSKEETDYLFEITKEYDMRFYIIADRYDYPGGPPRTIDVSCALP